MPDNFLPKSSVSPPVIDAALTHWAAVGRRSTFPMAGRSMWPFLREGDQVTVVHGDYSHRPGTLIVYRHGDGLAVHRLLRVFTLHGEPVMLLRGDNNARPDPPLHQERWVGRVVAIQRSNQVYHVDSPLWVGAGWLIAFLGRMTATLEGWASAGRRRLFPNRPAEGPGRLHQVVLLMSRLPIRLITFVLWKIAPHAQV